MNNQPLISVIIPVYNVEQYLSQCLDSILNQTYQNIELVCVNDGSPDNCGQILEKYAAMDERILVIAQKNQGLSGARNTGMRYAHGEYIMFVDSDDWIEAETCEVAVSAALKYGADLVMWSYVREFEDESKEKFMFWEHETVFDSKQVKTQLHRRLCGLYGEELRHPEYANAIETAWGKLYLAKNLLNNHVEFVDTKKIGTEDALFNLYALGYVQKAVYLRRCFNHYRKTNSGSLTSTYKAKLFDQWQVLFDLMNRYINDNHLSQEYADALNNRIALSILGLGLNIMDADVSALKKVKMLNDIVSHPRYMEAYKKLKLKYFPIHWRLFYGCAKYRISLGVFLFLNIIRRIIHG